MMLALPLQHTPQDVAWSLAVRPAKGLAGLDLVMT